ncbi:MAG: general secretion pathway protein GspK [Methylococcaceae bacterium]
MNKSMQSGFAMVIVIWVLSLLTIMAGSFALTMRRETTIVSAVKDNAMTLATAETGVTIAQQRLLESDENKRWQADGSVYQLQYEDAEIRVRLFLEQGKIDINKADEVLLTSMMSSTSLELDKQQALVNAIMDWRDNDDLVRIDGAEKQQYEEEGLSYQPANKPFQLIYELQLVLGMDANIYKELQELVTVYSTQAQVDLEVASKEVLTAVGDMEPEELEEYLQQRTDNNQAQLSTATEPDAQNGQKNSRSLEQGVYTIISEARLFGEVSSGIKVIMKKTSNGNEGNPFQVLDWQQLYQESSLFGEDVGQLIVTEQTEQDES